MSLRAALLAALALPLVAAVDIYEGETAVAGQCAALCALPWETMAVTPLGEGAVVSLYAADERRCSSGLLLPLFPGEHRWHWAVRAVLYFVALAFLFLGIAIIADIFMASIEVITSKTRKLVTRMPATGELVETEVLVWNETVANLTLMALGSSAPEILLAVIETVSTLGQKPEGGLGPATIVGSAAFNLLAISGICVTAIGGGETRRMKQRGVFAITAIFSVLAYVWLLLVLDVFSPGQVDLAEALITLALFPVLVLLAFSKDASKWCFGASGGDSTPADDTEVKLTGTTGFGARGYGKAAVAEMVHHERCLAGELPTSGKLLPALHYQQWRQTRVTQARYRIDAVRAFIGRPRVVLSREELAEGAAAAAAASGDAAGVEGEESKEMEAVRLSDVESHRSARLRSPRAPRFPAGVAVIELAATSHHVLESAGTVSVKVLRAGDMDSAVTVQYETNNGTALGGEDFVYTAGRLQFEAGQTEAEIKVEIIDDNEWEPEEHFFLRLHEPSDGAQLGLRATSVIAIIDDDTPGDFAFASEAYRVKETDGLVSLVVRRSNGASGTVPLRFRTVAGSAEEGKDFVHASGDLIFRHGETEKVIEVEIIDDGIYNKDKSFRVMLAVDDGHGAAVTGGEAIVTINSDEAFTRLVDKVAAGLNLQALRLSIGTESWTQQFRDALDVGNLQAATGKQMAIHSLTLPWKLLFAFVPPTSMAGGKVTFFAALAVIGLMTAVVGDLASMLGCALGIPDAITAITLVALGTSLPDTFASKSAAQNDDWADASIGNITGSNSVNVFLGLGLPWTIAALYAAATGTVFEVASGELGFSVLIFLFTAVVCLLVLVVREFNGGMLGGPVASRNATGALFITLWLVYVTLSSLRSTKVI